MKKIAFFTFFLAFESLAEYRVYQYYIVSKEDNQIKSKPSIISSTLDPVSYKSYYGGKAIQVDLLRTWFCPGYTGEGETLCSFSAETGVPNEN